MNLTKEQALERVKELQDYIEGFNNKKSLQNLIDDAPKIYYKGYKPIVEGRHILVEVPSANDDWSFASYRWVMEFCKINPKCYPSYNPNNKWNYIYINCESII